jgi:hypothetical protein
VRSSAAKKTDSKDKIKDKNLNKYEEYINMLFSDKFKKDYIEIRALDKENKEVKGQHFFETTEEFINWSAFDNFNIRISVFSKSAKSGASEHSSDTGVIFADYDNLKLSEIRTRLKKANLPEPTAIIKSGPNGYHLYWKLIERAGRESAPIFKELAKRTGADRTQAGLQAGGRLPNTYNLKDKPFKCRIVEINPKKRYQLKFIAETLGIKVKKDYQKDLIPNVNRPCIKSMLQGVDRGQRNFALGRITKYLQYRGISKRESRQIVNDWNDRNSPPENIKKINNDFNSYWKNDYKLLGCRLNNEDLQQNLAGHCDRFNCAIGGKIDTLNLDNSTGYNNRLLSDLRQISGKALVVYGVLSIYPNGLDRQELEDRTNMSDRTLKKAIKELKTLGYINYKKGIRKKGIPDFYKLKKQGTYNTGRTIVSNGAITGAVNKVITYSQFKLYVLLLKYALGTKQTYPNLTTLGKQLGITKNAVSLKIKKLEQAGYIDILRDYNQNAVVKNHYRLLI